MPKTKQPRKSARKPAAKSVRIYTLEVSANRSDADQPVTVSRTIQIRGDQSLDTLHEIITTAFRRQGEVSYEFQFDAGPLQPEGRRFVLPAEFDVDAEAGNPAAGRVTQTTLDQLSLVVDQIFGYWPDAGDDWWHQITVQSIKEAVPRGHFPKVTKQVGNSPFGRSRKRENPGSRHMGKDEGADTACLVGEVHLKKGEFEKAIEAFTRAIETRPTADAYQGRADAYRGLAAEDEREAQRLAQG